MTVQYSLNVISIQLFHRIHDDHFDVCVLGASIPKQERKNTTEEARKKKVT